MPEYVELVYSPAHYLWYSPFVRLSAEQLSLWNAIRSDNGLEPIDGALAECVLDTLDPELRKALLERLGVDASSG